MRGPPLFQPMTPSRLTLALDGGLTELPADGQIAFLNAPGNLDLSGLEISRVLASQSFFPDHDLLAKRGIEVSAIASKPAVACIVQCHRTRAATLDLLAQAVTLTQPGGMVFLDGAKTDGVESILKELKRRVGVVASYSKAHGKLAWFERSAEAPDLSNWQIKPRLVEGRFNTHPASFSSDGVDKGSAFLAENLPKLKGKIADLGAGWGFLSEQILRNDTVTSLDVIEADHFGLEAAKLNITDPRASFIWDDATQFSGGPYDMVVSNPPFHVSRKADPGLGQAFIRQAARVLKPSGQFWMVANRNLPYEDCLQDAFQHVETKSQNGFFKVIYARKPKTSRQPR